MKSGTPNYVWNSKGFRDFLKRGLGDRLARNEYYSLRAFARDLEVSPSQLSRYLNERSSFSDDTVEHILSHFDLNDLERAFLKGTAHDERSRSRLVEQYTKLPY
jgi:transcriptional regulator with XRE-family HTH domain